jgi:hypothetical protein
MLRANVLASALLLAGALAAPVQAQTEAGVDLGLFSSYVWRGLSLTNKPVAQPAIYLSIPAGNASITLGGWANIDLGKYDDPNDDISESGGLSSFNFAEFDPYAEVSFPVGKTTLTGGITAYIYPNDIPPGAIGLNSDFNTVELYGKAALDVLLSPQLSVYYDVDKVKGAYIEGSISHSFPASEKVSVDLGALAGFSAGQDANLDAAGDPQADFFNFIDNGLTHVDLSAGVSFSAGALSFAPALHFVINADDATKVTSPSNFDKDAKLWGGVTISWSKALGPEPEPTEVDKP